MPRLRGGGGGGRQTGMLQEVSIFHNHCVARVGVGRPRHHSYVSASVGFETSGAEIKTTGTKN